MMATAFTPGPHRTQNWVLRKPVARGRAMVVAQAPAAAEAGAAILAEGGSAADAAIATAFALAAVEPWNSGLGGIGFALVAPAGEPAVTLDCGPVAPRGLDPPAYPLTGGGPRGVSPWPEVEGDRNVHGALAACIPSAVAGYAALHRRWGRLPIAEVLAPAIALARRGVPRDWATTLKVAAAAATLRQHPTSAAVWLPDGLPPVPSADGTPGFLVLPGLAATLEQLARAGLQDLYTGEVAAALVADLAAEGGVLDAGDLAACAARWRPALGLDWQGWRVQLASGMTAGPTLAAVLGAIGGGASPDAAWFAALARALRAAYAARLAGAGDTAGQEPGDACTTHISVADADGMLVAFTTTLLSSFGAKLVLPRTGVLINNGVMWFDPRPGAANALGAGRRALTNICPVIASRGDGEALALGASGGRRILAAVAQLLAFSTAFGMDAEAAAHAPRIDVSGPEGVSADARLPEAVIAALAADAPVTVVEATAAPINFACPNLIRRGEDGMVEGVGDVASPSSMAVGVG